MRRQPAVAVATFERQLARSAQPPPTVHSALAASLKSELLESSGSNECPFF
jgi:hypothetical protein